MNQINHMTLNVHAIEREAMAEVEADERRDAIAAAKKRIIERKMRPLWYKFFPFTITITRR